MNCPRFTKLTIIVSLLLIFSLTSVNASTIAQNADSGLLNVSFNSFIKPSKIILAPVHFANQDADKFAKSLFFYFVDKLGFPQSPIQYVIDSHGVISKIINIDEDYTGTIVIAIDDRVTTLSSETLDQVSQIADKYDILKSSITINTINLNDDKKSLKYSEYKPNANFQKLLDQISALPKNIKKIVIDNVLPSQISDSLPGHIVATTVKFKNNSGFNLYSNDSNKIYISTADTKQSDLFINNDWFSKSKTGVIKESRIKNGDIGTMNLNIFTPLIRGDHIQSFVFTDQSGNKISPNFNITLKTKDQGQKVLQILENHGFGFVYVRSNPTLGTGIIGNVDTGVKAIYTDFKNGFYKVTIPTQNLEGWIPAEYAQIL